MLRLRLRLWLRRGVIEPITILGLGSSIFEEVAFRGLLLHALVSKLRLPPSVATLLSSLLSTCAGRPALPPLHRRSRTHIPYVTCNHHAIHHTCGRCVRPEEPAPTDGVQTTEKAW